MSANHNVEIRITAQNLSSPEFRQVLGDLKGLGTAADAMSVHVQQSGTAAKSAGGGFLDMASKVGMVTTGVFAAGQMLTGFLGTAGRVAGGILSLNANLETTQVAFEQLTGSAESATMLMSDLRDFAASTPFEFPELAKSAQLLLAFGDTAEEVIPHLTIIGDTVAAFGGGAAEIDRVTRALGQMEAKGKVTAEEMNQLTEVGINGFRILAEEMGISEAEVRKLSEQGRLFASDALPLLYEGMERAFGGGMQRQAETFTGLFSNLRDNINMAVADLSKPLFDKAKDGLSELVQFTQSAEFDAFIDDWTDKIEVFADDLSSFISEEGPGLLSLLQNGATAGLALATAMGQAGVMVGNLVTIWNDLPEPVQRFATAMLDTLNYADDLFVLIDLGAQAMARLSGNADGAAGSVLNFAGAVQQGFINTQNMSIMVDEQGTVLTEAAKVASEYFGTLVTGNDIARGYVTTQDGVTHSTDRFIEAVVTGTEQLLLDEAAKAKSAKTNEEIAASYGRQAEAAGRANEANTEHFHSLELGSGVAAELAYNLDKLKDVQDDLAGAYQQGIKIQSDYNAQASEYAGQASTIEKALEIQKERLDEGTISQEEYNRFLERGTEALGRFEGGQEDATLTAAEYAIQNAELMKIQDEIQAQFPGLVQGSAEYNQKLEEAATKAGISKQAIDDMQGSNGNLASVIANELVPALQDLINKILELDGKKATVTVETNFIATGDPVHGGPGFTEFEQGGTAELAEGGLVTAPTFALIGEAGPELVIPLNKIPASAKSDIMGNQQGAGNITFGEAGWLPFIESLIGDLDKASQAFSTEGLEHAQLFAETGTAALGTMVAALEFMNDLGDQALVLTETHHQSLEAMNHLIYEVVRLMAQNAESINGDYLEAGKEFAEGAGAGVDAFVSGLELMAALDDAALTLTEEHHQALEATNHLLYKVVRLMAQNAESLNGPGLEAAVALADATSTIVGAMSDTLAFLTEISDLSDVMFYRTDVIAGVATTLADNARAIAGAYAETAATWDSGANPQIEAFSASVGDSLSALTDTIGFLESINELGNITFYRVEVIAGVAKTLSDNAKAVADAFAVVAVEWDGSVNPSLTDFAEAIGDSTSGLSDVVDFLGDLSSLGEITFYSLDVTAGVAKTLSDRANVIADVFADLAILWPGEVNPALTLFAEAIGDSTTALGDAASALEVISGLGEITFYSLDVTAAAAKTLADRAFVIADAFADASATWDGTVNPQIAAFAEAAGDSLGLIAETGDALESITAFGKTGQPKNLEKLADEMADTVSVIVQAIEQINDDWQSRGAPDITEFAEGAGASVGIMGDAADAFEGIAEASRLSKRQVEIFESNFKVVLELVHDLAVLAEPYRDDAELFLDIITDIAESIRLASETIETVSGEAASSASNAANSMASLGSSFSGLTNKLGGVDHGGMVWDPVLGGWTDPLPDWMTAPPPPPPPPGVNDFLSGAAGFTTDSSHLMQMIAELAAANNIADDPLTTDINETLAGIDQTFADEQVKLLQDILANPDLFGGDVAAQALAAHVAEALTASLDALGLDFDQAGAIQDALAAAGVSAFEGLPDLLASSVGQAIEDSASIQGEIIGQHVAAAVGTVMRDFMAPGGFAAGFDTLTKQQAFLHQGGL